MLPKILQLPQFGTPVAEITIDGLSICCFNRPQKTWEVAFIRATHGFDIRVKQVDGLGKIIKESPTTRVIGSKQFIRFEVANSSDVPYTVFPEGFFKAAADFSRVGDDSHDFRWTVDILSDVPHGSFVRLKKGGPVTIATIPNALFFTKRVTEECVIFAPENVDPEQCSAFGRTDEIVGAAIFASRPQDIKIQYEDGSAVLGNFDMKGEAGRTYEISLRNMDQTKLDNSRERSISGQYVPGDFDRYYDFMDVSGTKHQIFAPPKDELRTDDGDCHPGRIGDAVNSLTPILP